MLQKLKQTKGAARCVLIYGKNKFSNKCEVMSFICVVQTHIFLYQAYSFVYFYFVSFDLYLSCCDPNTFLYFLRNELYLIINIISMVTLRIFLHVEKTMKYVKN